MERPYISYLMSAFICLFLSTAFASDSQESDDWYWIKAKATNKFERSEIANMGVHIENVDDDFVIVLGHKEDYLKLKESGRIITSFQIDKNTLDFPKSDSNFHDYKELSDALLKLKDMAPNIVDLGTIGKSLEGRHLYHIRISTDLGKSHQKPGIVFMGSHHAREHLSTEMPLMLAQYLVTEYKKGNPKIKKLVSSREIHIIPLVNPDGKEYDISGSRYKMWRKNRRSTYGVDLNRNYAYKWGTGGASPNPSSDTYRGPKPFSEPETLAVKEFIENQTNINILLSFHTFSELILYPWGHTYDPITDQKGRMVHETMAKTMAKWNGYKPQQSSDLYIASGDTTDWSYGEHKIISFTFELDPKSIWQGGFYPGQSKIPVIFQKNINPSLYLIEYADNPYRVLKPTSMKYGLSTPLFESIN